MSLYQKHRPVDFSGVIGNESVVASLQKMIESDKLPKVLLFHGPAGTGKTTFARIVVNELGIKKIDVKELDIGALRGIDNVREIRAASVKRPMGSKKKVYILDEFHAATADAKTAILKWLEDTPEHVLPIICTTDPGKLPKTIISRCVSFATKPLDSKEVRKLIETICTAEGKKISKSVRLKIQNLCDGSPRHAITLLESVIDLDEENALSVLNPLHEHTEQIKDLFSCLLRTETPWSRYREVLKGIKDEPETVRRSVLGYMTALMLSESNNSDRSLIKLAGIIENFENSWYDIGKAGLVKACFSVYIGGRD